jgi:hypothetical protein
LGEDGPSVDKNIVVELIFQGKNVPKSISSTKSHFLLGYMIFFWWSKPILGTSSMVNNSKMDFIPFFSWSYVIKNYYSMGLASNQLWMSKPRKYFLMREEN